MEQNENHVGNLASGVVMLAAILVTYTTYLNYKDDQLATAYDSDAQALEQTASALVGLRLQAQSLSEESTSTPAEDSEVEAPELQ